MQRILAIGIGGLVLLCTSHVRADFLFLDFDPGTAGVQTSVGVTSGSSVTVKALYMADTGATASLFGDVVGVDINWGLASDMATATYTTPGGAVAGPVAGVAGVLDFFGGGATSPGLVLTGGGLGVGVAGFTMNAGGAGLVDAGGLDGFGGALGNFSPAPGLVDIMGWDFTVSGSPGEIVTFAPSGVLGAVAPVPGGSIFFDADAGPLWSPETISGGFIVIVPEPSTSIALAASCLALFHRRKR